MTVLKAVNVADVQAAQAPELDRRAGLQIHLVPTWES